MTVAVPIRRRQLVHAGQRRESFLAARASRPAAANKPRAARFPARPRQDRAAIAVHVRPEYAALRRVRLVQRQDLKLSAAEVAGQGFGGFAREFRNLRAVGILRDGHDIEFGIALQIVRAIGADGLGLEINFRAELAGGLLEAEPERRRAVPIHQQQILPSVAVHVRDLHGLGRAGIGDFLRLAKGASGCCGRKYNEPLSPSKTMSGRPSPFRSPTTSEFPSMCPSSMCQRFGSLQPFVPWL